MSLLITDLAAEHYGEAAPRHSAWTTKSYETVVADLKFAITDRNYRITSENEIGGALGRRHGRSFNASTVVQFCNLEVAREILDVAPDFLLHMPCKVVVYRSDDKTMVETWLLPLDPRLVHIAPRINRMLRGIVSEVTR